MLLPNDLDSYQSFLSFSDIRIVEEVGCTARLNDTSIPLLCWSWMVNLKAASWRLGYCLQQQYQQCCSWTGIILSREETSLACLQYLNRVFVTISGFLYKAWIWWYDLYDFLCPSDSHSRLLGVDADIQNQMDPDSRLSEVVLLLA